MRAAEASWRYAAPPTTANGPLQVCNQRASPERVSHLPTHAWRPSPPAASRRHRAAPSRRCASRSAALRLCRHKRSRKLLAGAVSGAGGRQEALQVSAGKHRLSQNQKANTRPSKQRRAVGRRGHRGRRAERRRLRSLPDRRRRRRAAADAVHRSHARRQDVRFPPSRAFSLRLLSLRSRLLVRGCDVASAPAAVTPAPTAKKARLDDAATVSPPGCAPPFAVALLVSLTNSSQLRPCTAFPRAVCSPLRR
jgi:hypothetical protein